MTFLLTLVAADILNLKILLAEYDDDGGDDDDDGDGDGDHDDDIG